MRKTALAITVVLLSDSDFNWPLPITATKDNDKK